jgi:flagellar protein FlaG
MNPLSALPAQAQVPQAPAAAVQPKVVVQTPPKGGGVEQKQAPEAKVDAAGEAAATAAKARAEVNMEQYARASKEVMQVAAQQIQGYLKDSGRNLNVTLDESTGKYVARVVNPETGEVVRSLPSEETLRIARNIDQMRGMLVNQRA